MKRNNKILLVGILTVFMVIAVSYATAVNTNTANTERKESPLFHIRTRRAITEKITTILENIRTKFLGERMFFLPFQWLRYRVSNLPILHFTIITECEPDCEWTDINRCKPFPARGFLKERTVNPKVLTCYDTMCQTDCTYIITACPDICP